MRIFSQQVKDDLGIIWSLYKLYKVEIIMKILIFLIISILIVMFLMIMKPSVHATGFQWRHFGAAPFAKTGTVAIQKRHLAFQFLPLGIQPGVATLIFVATNKPGAHVLVRLLI